MRLLTACLFSAFSVCASNAWSNEPACPVAAPEGRGLPTLQTPVAGELAVGFGMRAHPILQVQRMHTGVDYAAEAGTPVHASAAGQVVFAAPDGAYGNRVVIAHGNGNETAYGHLVALTSTKATALPKAP
jgi:murein DD-endopeptidase MepM/ murein hydrolase activator NlpD